MTDQSDSGPSGPMLPNLKRRQLFQLRRRRYLPLDATPSSETNSKAPSPSEDALGPEAAQEIEQLRARVQRLQADHDNFRKRVAREREDQTKFALEGLMKELIVSMDNFDRAMAHHAHTPELDAFAQGLELIEQHLWDVLAKNGLERIEAQGQPFNPHIHEAIAAEVSDEVEEGTVLEVVQEGYALHGRVIRPSLVKVAKRA